MNTFMTNTKLSSRQNGLKQAWHGVLVAGLTGIGGIGYAQEPLSLVPSIGVGSTPSVAVPQTEDRTRRDAPATATARGARWNDFPVSKRVALTRATVDKGGYRLYNTTGATITVPFTNRDIHVMKFAVSPDSTTFFVNDGVAPILYLPQNGWLINSNVSGGRWYPFSPQFQPIQPVFLAIAPNYSEYATVIWYPNTITYGGYYGVTSYIDGGVFQPTSGVTFYIGTQSYNGWSPYRDYVLSIPRPAYRPRVPANRPRDYPNDPRYNGGYNGAYGGYNGYGTNPYPSQYNPYNIPGNGYTYPSGGFGFPGGGYGYPGGGASSSGMPGGPLPSGGMPGAPLPSGGAPGAYRPSDAYLNRFGPTFKRVVPPSRNNSNPSGNYPRQ
ncbi:MAG: hypothetical protein H8F28_24155 [Fibrella sp.]|nr:hypothetical protein [Armatimonadota bacterium]